jgi:hypothetical protein
MFREPRAQLCGLARNVVPLREPVPAGSAHGEMVVGVEQIRWTQRPAAIAGNLLIGKMASRVHAFYLRLKPILAEYYQG